MLACLRFFGKKGCSMNASEQYMSCTFKGTNAFVVIYDKTLLKAYRNTFDSPEFFVKVQNANGAAYDGQKLIYTCNDCSNIWIVDRKCTSSIDMHFDKVRIIGLVRNDKETCVVEIIDGESKRYIVYDILNCISLFELPVQNFRDIAKIGDDSYFCLCDDDRSIAVYEDDFNIANCYGFEFQHNVDTKSITIIGRIEIHTVEDSFTEKHSVFGSYDNGMKVPLFDQYLYHWPDQLSISSSGRYIVYYIKDILEGVSDSILIAERATGDVFRVFQAPEVMHICKKRNPYQCFVCYNDITEQLILVNLDFKENLIYNVSCVSESNILELNHHYNSSLSQRKEIRDFAFKMLVHNALVSCACSNSTSDSIENRPVPYDGDEPYIFISYSHKDYKSVWRLIEQIQKRGYRIWYDEGIIPGTEWDAYIEQKLEKSAYFMCCITNNYWNSRNCLDELKYAVDLNNKEMLLVYLDDSQIPDGTGLRMRIGRIQNIHRSNFESEKAFLEKIVAGNGFDIATEKCSKVMD